MELQKILDNKNNPDQKEQCWSNLHSTFEDTLQCHRNKDSIVLAQKQACVFVNICEKILK